MKEIVKEYANKEVTVVWKPDLCIHSENCFHGLPEVFNPNQNPWINVDAAESEKIKDQVGRCPSGALSILSGNLNDTGEIKTSIELAKDGPLLIAGDIELKDSMGNVQKIINKVTAFCRCGASQNKPFCDGSHKKIGFSG